jgi:hypothetical protein
MKVNLNDNIWVKFNDYTDECLLKNHKALYGTHSDKYFPYKPKVHENGWVEIQLWTMAQMFGRHMTCGVRIPIDTEIYIGEEPPKKEITNDNK